MYIGSGKELFELAEKEPFKLVHQILENIKRVTIDHKVYDTDFWNIHAMIMATKKLIEDAELHEQFFVFEYSLEKKNLHGDFMRPDLLILGKNQEGKDCCVIIETKGWVDNIEREDKFYPEFLWVKLGQYTHRKPHPSRQANDYRRTFEEMKTTLKINNKNDIRLFACSYLYNIDRWLTAEKNTALYGQRSARCREKAPMYTLLTRKKLLTDLKRKIGCGSGKDALMKLKKISTMRSALFSKI